MSEPISTPPANPDDHEPRLPPSAPPAGTDIVPPDTEATPDQDQARPSSQPPPPRREGVVSNPDSTS